MSKVKWTLLKKEYPLAAAIVQAYLDTHPPNLEFDYVGVVDNILAFDMEVGYSVLPSSNKCV